MDFRKSSPCCGAPENTATLALSTFLGARVAPSVPPTRLCSFIGVLPVAMQVSASLRTATHVHSGRQPDTLLEAHCTQLRAFEDSALQVIPPLALVAVRPSHAQL